MLATLEGGCSAPVGALAEVVEGDDGDELWVRAIALSHDGGLSVRMSASGPPADATGVGTRLASEMLADGAAELTLVHSSTSEEAEGMTRAKTTSNGSTPTSSAPGWVSFVGSGPGDPDLLTVRAVDLLRDAEVVVTEAPDHEAMVRRLLGLPARSPTRPTTSRPVRSSSTAASARTASR